MSKTGKQLDATGRKKVLLIASISVLLALDLIPFAYSKTVKCSNYDPINLKQTLQQERGRKMGLPFAYWQHKEGGCTGPKLSFNNSQNSFSGAALFWDIGIFGLLSVGITALINPRRATA